MVDALSLRRSPVEVLTPGLAGVVALLAGVPVGLSVPGLSLGCGIGAAAVALGTVAVGLVRRRAELSVEGDSVQLAIGLWPLEQRRLWSWHQVQSLLVTPQIDRGPLGSRRTWAVLAADGMGDDEILVPNLPSAAAAQRVVAFLVGACPRPAALPANTAACDEQAHPAPRGPARARALRLLGAVCAVGMALGLLALGALQALLGALGGAAEVTATVLFAMGAWNVAMALLHVAIGVGLARRRPWSRRMGMGTGVANTLLLGLGVLAGGWILLPLVLLSIALFVTLVPARADFVPKWAEV